MFNLYPAFEIVIIRQDLLNIIPHFKYEVTVNSFFFFFSEQYKLLHLKLLTLSS